MSNLFCVVSIVLCFTSTMQMNTMNSHSKLIESKSNVKKLLSDFVYRLFFRCFITFDSIEKISSSAIFFVKSPDRSSFRTHDKR